MLRELEVGERGADLSERLFAARDVEADGGSLLHRRDAGELLEPLGETSGVRVLGSLPEKLARSVDLPPLNPNTGGGGGSGWLAGQLAGR